MYARYTTMYARYATRDTMYATQNTMYATLELQVRFFGIIYATLNASLNVRYATSQRRYVSREDHKRDLD
ncbi:hypothetical protein PM082_015487 [Marasmius tenuissimus]|nr:hypothetical protein PM082_015487 [Marasmius tenuissimus]